MNAQSTLWKKRSKLLALFLVLTLLIVGTAGCSCASSLLPGSDDAKQNSSSSKSSRDDEEEEEDEDEEDEEDESQEDNESEGSSRRSQEVVHREDPTACQEALKAFLDAYQAKDPSANVFLINGGEESLTYNGFQGMLASSFTYEVGDVDMSDTVPYVSVVITNTDFKAILENYLGSLDSGHTTLADTDSKKEVSQDQIVEDLTALLEAESRPERTFTCLVPVYYLNEEDGLKIEMTQDLSNALTGGFAEFVSNYLWESAGDGSDAE